jgi:hypothetical protein
METGGVREIQLTRGLVALVDAADFEHVSRKKWGVSIKPTGYAMVNHWWKDRGRGGKRHSISLARHIMKPEPGQWVDHINGDTFDNRRSNLRCCQMVENNRNKAPAKAKSVPYKGVYLSSRYSYRARIFRDGRNIALGSYRSAEEAARAYDRAAAAQYGEFARLNFPEGL